MSKIAGIVFPAFAMLTLTVLTMFGAFGEGNANKAFFLVGLTIIFPLTFLIQGISCALNHIHPFIALIVSYVAFGVVTITLLDHKNLDFAIYYLIFWLVGYFGTKGIQKWRNRQN